jgi:hypothetical protein
MGREAGQSASVAREAPPTRLSAVVYEAKAAAFRLRRSLIELPGRPARLARCDSPPANLRILARSATPLWSDTAAGERRLQQGKVQNLRRAAAALDRTVVPQGAVFSFWRQLGKATRARGFVDGRMLQQGCLVPSVGGGLCQLSNALYETALTAGCEIVERHAHSRVVPGSAAEFGRDATVAWNYVDLRFRAPADLVLRVTLGRDELEVALLGVDAGLRDGASPASGGSARAANSCASCERTECFRREPAAAPAEASRTAFLVDENWPEFQALLAAEAGEGDLLALPLDGARWRLARYRWEARGLARLEAPLAAIARTSALRRAGASGPARRAAEIQTTARLAEVLAHRLPHEIERLHVAQSLLPHLWRGGWLGGRAFSVWMTRLPIAELQARLDGAFARAPDRASLADFRATPWLAEAEAEALAAAERVFTPHPEIAALFPGRAVLLPWRAPPPRAAVRPGASLVFPGPTAARKGAWEVREAARALDLEVVLLGSELEGADFWAGVRTRRPGPGPWLDGVLAVVQPAVIEDQPRRLLCALAAGVPVIATAACGLGAASGAVTIPDGDADALIAALQELRGARAEAA